MSRIPGTREEVKGELEMTIRKLAAIRADIRLARAQAAASGRYMSITQYHNMLAQEESLKAKTVALQSQLSHMPNPRKGTFLEAFMSAAEEYLDPSDYENIKTLADTRWKKSQNDPAPVSAS
jgi:hypothetical protein